MGTFDRQIETVKRLINKYGQTVQYKTIVQTIPNVSKPWEKLDTTSLPIDVKIVFISPSASGASLLGRQLIEYLKGIEIPSGEIRGLMAPNSAISLKISDIIVRDSKELKIKAIDILAPNGQEILYTIEFEK